VIRGELTIPKQTRRNHGATFKAKVALEALRGEKTVAEPSAKYEAHQTLINRWKKTLTEQAPAAFEKSGGKCPAQAERLVADPYKQIGRLKVENDLLSVRQDPALMAQIDRQFLEMPYLSGRRWRRSSVGWAGRSAASGCAG